MKIETSDPQIAALAVKDFQKTPSQNSEGLTPGATAGGSLPADKVSVNIEVPRKTLDTLQQFGKIGDFLNTLASNLRQTNGALDSASKIIDKMKASLDTIIKNFPPYSVESRERMDLLMSYASLRKEITSLMIPPPPPPIYEKVQHLWQGVFPVQNGTIPTPQLPADVPDSHIKIAAAQLDALSGQVGLVKEAMTKSVQGI